ncbi:hypothetical protein [Tenacibaculum finnmarkense]|uniref:hypothetical protein n=1 Tax=Tenacibaculum finnmarkense TaxID=2781243 RepID=UPI003BB60C07
MKHFILFIYLLFSMPIFSQCLEKIKQQNTFFILLNKNDKLSKYGCNPKAIIPYCGFLFFKKSGKPFEYNFNYNKYPSLDHKYDDTQQRMVFRIHKSFIRKNKDIIITREFMEKMGDIKMISLLDDNASNKTIFLINTAETKDGTILLREVQIDYMKGE